MSDKVLFERIKTIRAQIGRLNEHRHAVIDRRGSSRKGSFRRKSYRYVFTETGARRKRLTRELIKLARKLGIEKYEEVFGKLPLDKV